MSKVRVRIGKFRQSAGGARPAWILRDDSSLRHFWRGAIDEMNCKNLHFITLYYILLHSFTLLGTLHSVAMAEGYTFDCCPKATTHSVALRRRRVFKTPSFNFE